MARRRYRLVFGTAPTACGHPLTLWADLKRGVNDAGDRFK